MMPEKKERPERTPEADIRPEQSPRVIDAEDLFQGDREVWLEHTGVRYRLRITRRNKLILQK
jgi:hemin uptake protein HemP